MLCKVQTHGGRTAAPDGNIVALAHVAHLARVPAISPPRTQHASCEFSRVLAATDHERCSSRYLLLGRPFQGMETHGSPLQGRQDVLGGRHIGLWGSLDCVAVWALLQDQAGAPGSGQDVGQEHQLVVRQARRHLEQVHIRCARLRYSVAAAMAAVQAIQSALQVFWHAEKVCVPAAQAECVHAQNMGMLQGKRDCPGESH